MKEQLSFNERIRRICHCTDEIDQALKEIKQGKLSMTGPWLGYMDYIEELHYLIHEEES